MITMIMIKYHCIPRRGMFSGPLRRTVAMLAWL